MNVLMPARGDVVQHHGAPVWLLASCDLENVAYTCLTCAQDFPTKHHFGLHAKTEGEHSVVRWCAKHGLEAITPVPKEAPV